MSSILEYFINYLRYAQIKHSDLMEVRWLVLTDKSALFQRSAVMLQYRNMAPDWIKLASHMTYGISSECFRYFRVASDWIKVPSRMTFSI